VWRNVFRRDALQCVSIHNENAVLDDDDDDDDDENAVLNDND
jgi:hypothetical protein